MSIEIAKSSCMGCSACLNVCSKNAIDMVYSEDGFLYPRINDILCTSCGACQKRCPVLNATQRQNLKKAYYGHATDRKTVAQSSSGGFFSVLAGKILEAGGVVFGAVYDKENHAIVYKHSDEVDFDELRRSKYVESRVSNSFAKAKEYLEQGRMVMFVGMPCHITGLKLFLNKKYDNLLTCDFICGGAASPVNFKEHLQYLEKKYKSNVKRVNFRPKLYGWKEHAIKIEFENGKSYKNYAFLDTYFRGFVYEGVIKRESCIDCKFRNNHAADIILADFWGYKALGINEENTGLSLLVTNSDKGERYLKEIPHEKMLIHEIPLQYAMYNFTPFSNPEKAKEKKRKFLTAYQKYGFEKAARITYMKKCIRFKIKKIIKGFIKK